MNDHLATSLAAILDKRRIIADPDELITYETDAALDRGVPAAAVLPQSAEEVRRVVAWAAARGMPLIARGAGTGLSGGAVPELGGVIVGLAGMKAILEFDADGRSAVVEPGVVNLTLDERARADGLYFPPDPASGRSSTLGGNLAENAGGPHCFKYGVTTNYVTGLEVVLADGRVIHPGGRALDYPEYDLCGLLTGSEGTLGIITRASVRLIRNPPGVKTLMAAFDSVEQAGAAVSAVIAAALIPATMEMMDRKMVGIIEDSVHAGLPTDAGALLIAEVDGYPSTLDSQIEEVARIFREHAARDLRIARTAEDRDKIWYARKSAAGAVARLAPFYITLDGTVPRTRVAELLGEVNRICDHLGIRVGYLFHAGDGNLHPLMLIEDLADREQVARVLEAGHQVMALVVGMDGAITGEHGVGTEKRAYMPLMYNPDELSAMLDVKAIFDPKGILNPGKIFPADLPARQAAPPPGPPPGSPFSPASAAEAAEAIRAWSAAGTGVVIRGGGTKSREGSGTSAVLSTAGLCGIRAYARDDLYVTVGAGTPLEALQAELAPDGMWVPLVSPWHASTVGGIVATNFNAPLRIRYGGARDLVLAATIVLPDGRTIRAGRPVVKNVAGYDLAKVFVGSYGTLGLMVDLTFKVTPLPRARRSVLVPVDDPARGLALGRRLLRVCLAASALLLCRGVDGLPGSAPFALVYTVEGRPEEVQAELVEVRTAIEAEGAAWTEVEGPSGSDLWTELLRAAPAAGHTLRAGVAPKDLPGVLPRLLPSLGTAPFVADLASGLLYIRDIVDVEAVRRPARDMGGYAVVLAPAPARDASQQLDEQRAVDRWGHTPDSLDLMRALKARWDSQAILNPGAFIV